MKKNFSVNIGSRIFHIDEDAYERLNNYQGRLRKFFAADEGCDEILTDIEMRIAELLEQKKMGEPAIINLKHIEEVIVSMGEPDELSETKREPIKEKTQGKLYRDADNRQIGGVCAGIAAWLGVDPVWIRVAVILITLFYGTGVIIYLILWLILPEAKTTSEKLEMHRQTINIDTLRDEVASASLGLKKTGNSVMNAIGTFLRFVTEIVSRVFIVLFRVLRRTAGVLILIIALSLFAGMSMIFLVRDNIEFGMYHLAPATLSNTFEWLLPTVAVRWQAYIAFALLFIGMVGLMIFVGLRLMLKWPPVRWLVISLLVLLFVAGLINGGVAIFQYSRASGQVASESQRKTFSLKNTRIQLSLGSYDRAQYWAPLIETGVNGQYNDVLGNISLSVRPAPADSLILTSIKSASATYSTEASKYIRSIANNFDFKDSVLIVNPYFRFPLKDGMHYQKADLIIGIPVNTQIQLDEETCDLINSADFIGETNEAGIYLMTNSGLQIISLKEVQTIE